MLCETWNWENHYSTVGLTGLHRSRAISIHYMQTSSVHPQPASYPIDIRESLVDKQPWSKAEYLLPSSAKIKFCGAIPPFPYMPSMLA
jgi:hypothetical protein